MVVKRKTKAIKGAARKDDMTPEERERKFEKMMDEMGGLEYVQKGFELFEKNLERLWGMHDELVEKYPDKWVGIAGRDEPIVADSSAELYAKLDELGLDRSTAAAKLIRSKPRRMIL